MRTLFSLSLLAAAAAATFAVSGCAMQNADPADEAEVAESEQALALASLYGKWEGESGTIYSIDFSKDAAETLGGFLKGRSFTASIDTGIRCFTTPCPSQADVGGVWKLSNGTKLTLASYDKPTAAFGKILGDYSVKITNAKLVLTKKDGTLVESFHRPKACAPNTKLCMRGYHYDGTAGVCACVPDPKGWCNTDADCRLEDDYCTGCDCRALSSSETLPACTGPGVRCQREPCGGLTARCVANACTAR
jgi:hypothetical protein